MQAAASLISDRRGWSALLCSSALRHGNYLPPPVTLSDEEPIAMGGRHNTL